MNLAAVHKAQKATLFFEEKKSRHAFHRESSIVKIHHQYSLFFWTQQKAWFCHTTFLLRGSLTVSYGSHNLCESEKFPWSLVSLILPLDSSVRDAAAAL